MELMSLQRRYHTAPSPFPPGEGTGEETARKLALTRYWIPSTLVEDFPVSRTVRNKSHWVYGQYSAIAAQADEDSALGLF